jgi:hypothetical protein
MLAPLLRFRLSFLGIPCVSVFRKLSSSDFDPREKVWTRFPPEGSKLTPPHHSVDFRWKDYCPAVFRCHTIALLPVDFGHLEKAMFYALGYIA